MTKEKKLKFSKGAADHQNNPTPPTQKTQFLFSLVCITPTPFSEFSDYYKRLTPDYKLADFEGPVKGLSENEIQDEWMKYYMLNQSFEKCIHVLTQFNQPMNSGTVLTVGIFKYKIFDQEYQFDLPNHFSKRIITLL